MVKTFTPLHMGDGFIDPDSTLDRGLIYNATAQDYVNLLCSLNIRKEDLSSLSHQVLMIVLTRLMISIIHSFYFYFFIINSNGSRISKNHY